VFGFAIDVSPRTLIRDKDARFIRHATVLVQMIETAIGMLGPDIELLTEIMTGLGKKHVAYGVTPDMFPILGQCLIDTLAECLNDDCPGSFGTAARDAWEEVYFDLATDILQVYDKKKNGFES
jgi:hemoglobin-like flavoprotein